MQGDRLNKQRAKFFRRSAATALLALASAICGGGPAQADDLGEADFGRAAEWRRLRVEKSQRLEPPEQGILERNLRDIESGDGPSILQVNYRGLHPSINFLNEGSRLGLGARYWAPDIRRTRLDIHASAMFARDRYRSAAIQFGLLQHAGRELPLRSTKGDELFELGGLPRGLDFSSLILFGSVRHRRYPDQRFFGLGDSSRIEDETSYALDDQRYELVAGFQPSRHLALTLRTSYLDMDVADGSSDKLPATSELFNETSAPGLENETDFLILEPQLFLDYRDEALNPHSGGMLALSWARYDDRGGDQLRFDRFALDARIYLPLGSPQRVLALRGFTSTDETRAGRDVPFFLQQRLGGSHSLRGYSSHRFRGRNLLNLQAEYRWEALPYVELAMFLDTGSVTNERDALELDGLRTSYGLGVRIKAPSEILLRVDFANSEEGFRVLVRTGPSF